VEKPALGWHADRSCSSLRILVASRAVSSLQSCFAGSSKTKVNKLTNLTKIRRWKGCFQSFAPLVCQLAMKLKCETSAQFPLMQCTSEANGIDKRYDTGGLIFICPDMLLVLLTYKVLTKLPIFHTFITSSLFNVLAVLALCLSLLLLGHLHHPL